MVCVAQTACAAVLGHHRNVIIRPMMMLELRETLMMMIMMMASMIRVLRLRDAIIITISNKFMDFRLAGDFRVRDES